MESASSIIAYLFELVIQDVPPLMNRQASMILLGVAICGLVLTTVITAMSRFGPFPRHTAVVVGVGLAIIAGMGFSSQMGIWKLLPPAYVATVIVARLGEGVLVGKALKWWHVVVAASFIVGVVALFGKMTEDHKTAVKYGWTALVAVLASRQMVRMVTNTSADPHVFNTGALWLLFVAVHVYLPHDAFARTFCIIVFPLGVALGLADRVMKGSGPAT